MTRYPWIVAGLSPRSTQSSSHSSSHSPTVGPGVSSEPLAGRLEPFVVVCIGD